MPRRAFIQQNTRMIDPVTRWVPRHYVLTIHASIFRYQINAQTELAVRYQGEDLFPSSPTFLYV